jgi:hypothetical protein
MEISVPYTANQTCAWLRRGGEEVLYPLSYSRYFEPRDFYLFGPIKKHLADKRLTTDADIKQAVPSWLQTLYTDFSCAETQVFFPLWDKRLADGDYTEVWCVPSAIQIPCTH